ncbi:ABC-2 family transporter protein [Symmachiella dynata]|uniref:ABC transporter permease subunit/CPBP intramembrane protease n=1 Tax=Symmachiella dynata TaxID=2527995 RepID=UPI0011890780|nr:ABC transporter permease subunit/CPBP intramembrane protease [Symmachiella dynata]QDT47172.1 ABC-2 family transporter protein [Symmachiella dynata]
MINWKNVKLIFMRELRDQLRDRRTLFMIIVLPLLLYPGLGIGMVQLTVLFSEQPRTVVILGDNNLSPQTLPPLLEGDGFARDLFSDSADAAKLRVLSQSELVAANSDGKVSEKDAELLQRAESISSMVPERERLQQELAELQGTAQFGTANTERMEELRRQLTAINGEMGKLFAESKIQTLVIIPQDFGESVASANQQLVERGGATVRIADYARPLIVHNSADEKSQITYSRVAEVLEHWEDQILDQRLELADLPANLHRPVEARGADLAMIEQLSSKLWSQLFPGLLVLMSITGAFYPAIDLAAGEKERGTMETLLICPASRSEIVVGKFFTVMSFSIMTALLNLISMGMTGRYMVGLMGARTMPGMTTPTLPSLGDVAWIVIFLVPLAAMFSSLCLALATFARSSKEGQYYLTPLLMVTLGLTMFCLSPGVELTERPMYSVMPVCGVALLLKGLLMSSLSTAPLYVYAVPVLGSTLFYSFLALYWAIEQFKSEDVLFREAERFDLKLWVHHLLRDKEPTPSFSEAVICFILIMMLQFVAISSSGGGAGTGWMIRMLLITQIAVIASPALFMGVMLTTSLRQTFRLYLPRLKMVAVAMVLAVAMHVLSFEWLHQLDWFFPKLPDSMEEPLKRLMSANMPWWIMLGTMALAPAICEELAFRGFILSGLRRTGRTWMAIGLSSCAFGFMHMIPHQVFNATLLGLVLGIIAIRSNSLLPGVIFHLIYNSLGVIHGRIGPQLLERFRGNPLVRDVDGQMLYGWPTIVIAALIALPLLWRLIQGINPRSPRQVDQIAPNSAPTLVSPGAGSV